MEKKNLTKVFLLLGGALLIYGITQAASFIKSLKITFSNISLSGTVSNPVVLLTLKIENPTNISVTVTDLIGDLLYGSQIIGNVESVNLINVNANSSVYLDLKVQTTFSQGLTIIKNLLNKSLANNFFFNGSLKVDGVQVPYKGKLSW